MRDQSNTSEVNAKEIVEILQKGSKGPEKLLLRPKVALLPSERKTIVHGDLDLRNLVIDRPLQFNNCVFEGKVDLRYCEFKQVVNFTYCTFQEAFNSGDASRSLTIYRKDLIFKGCCFKDVAYFNRIQVEGDADFTDSCFDLKSLEKRDDSLPRGSEYTVDFANAQFAYQFVCDDAIFSGPVDFKAIKCGASGSFKRVQFIIQTELEDKPEINFNWAAFERNLVSRRTRYGAKVNFRSVKCGYNAFFERARFDSEADLRFLEVGRDLDLRWTYWAEKAKLGQIEISKKLSLEGACFQGPIDLYDSNIGVLELWDPNHSEDEIFQVRSTEQDVLSIVVEEDHHELHMLDESEIEADYFRNRLRKRTGELVHSLYEFFHDLFPFLRAPQDQDEPEDLVKELFPFKMRHERRVTGLNLTGTTFDRFHGGPSDKLARRLALKLANKQDPTKFSIDPYLQLRKHYLKIGDENTAGVMRTSGYRALRKNAWRHWRNRGGRTAWSWKRWLAEIVIYWPTSYGHRIWHLLLLAIGSLFIVGTLIFWSHGALIAASPDTKGPLEVPPNENYVGKLFERSIYSLDLLIPALDLRYEAMWIPSHWLAIAYATIHSIFGWVLAALLIAWLTGVIKPRD